MARGYCPTCERRGRPAEECLHEITPTGEPMSKWGGAMYWRLVMHSDGKGGLCPGGGEKV